jgi:hypothetical protein
LNLMTIGQRVSCDVNRRHGQRDVDVIAAVLISQPRFDTAGGEW